MILFTQRDSKWKDIPLGYGTSTIGGYGCYLTSLCSGLLLRGYSFYPKSLNDKFKVVPTYPELKQGAWVGPYNNYIDVTNLHKYYPDIFNSFQQIDPWGSSPATADVIKDNLIALGRVSAVPIGGTGDHYVLITGSLNGVAQIWDPWSGTQEPITKRWANYGYIKGLRLFDVKPFIQAPVTSLKEQLIIDGYYALLGEYPTDDEKKWRLGQNLNTLDLLTNICEDKRFIIKWNYKFPCPQISTSASTSTSVTVSTGDATTSTPVSSVASADNFLIKLANFLSKIIHA